MGDQRIKSERNRCNDLIEEGKFYFVSWPTEMANLTDSKVEDKFCKARRADEQLKVLGITRTGSGAVIARVKRMSNGKETTVDINYLFSLLSGQRPGRFAQSLIKKPD